MFRRYAIFYTPPQGGLADSGANWLGWSSADGRATLQPALAGLNVEKITRTPRPYGFHGTLKAPFRLAEGVMQADLVKAVSELATALPSARMDGLALTPWRWFIALLPVGETGALSALAFDVVRKLDWCRAPLTQAEMEKRRQSRLTPVQEAYLAKWGYPYVGTEFGFHMTLTGRVPEASADQIAKTMAGLFDPVLPQPFVVDALTLMGEDGDGWFHQIERFSLQQV